MKGHQSSQSQEHLFEVTLDHLIDPKDTLVKLAHKIDWSWYDSQLSPYYINFGRPAKPIRLMVSLLLLKQMFGVSDDELVDHWRQNPYWQYFSGMNTFQWKAPCVSSDLSHFRNRIGAEGAEIILKGSIELFDDPAKCEKEVLVDSTVQEKNITYPTDVKQYRKLLKKGRAIAASCDLSLRQSYVREEKKLLKKLQFSTHPKNRKKAKKAQKRLKTMTGALIRDLDRKLGGDITEAQADFLTLAYTLLGQARSDKEKIYSLHEPQVHCISKGKEHKKYEYGTKISIVRGMKHGLILGVLNIGKQYDGHSLDAVLDQTEKLTGTRPQAAIVDRGYRGKSHVGSTKILRPGSGKSTDTAYQKQKERKRFRARAGIEPVIGHLKHDFGMLKSYLKGVIGDTMNALLAGAAFNMRKWMREIGKFLSHLFGSPKYILKLIFLRRLGFSLENTLIHASTL